jgi:hypothetical protein
LEAVRSPRRPPELVRRPPRRLDRRCGRSRRAQEGKCSSAADGPEAGDGPVSGRAARAWPEAQKSRLRKPSSTSRWLNVFGSSAVSLRSPRSLDGDACRRLCQSNSISFLAVSTSLSDVHEYHSTNEPRCEMQIILPPGLPPSVCLRGGPTRLQPVLAQRYEVVAIPRRPGPASHVR